MTREAAVVGIAYAAVVALVGVAAMLWARRGIDARSEGRIALRLGLAALVTYVVLLPFPLLVAELRSDEPQYLLITQSLVLDGDVDLRNDYVSDRHFSFFPRHFAPEERDAIDTGRAFFPIRDLGLPFAAVVPFAFFGRAGVDALMCVVGALLVGYLYRLARGVGLAPRVAFATVALLALLHPLLTYTTQIFPELLAALFFAATVTVLAEPGPPTPRRLLVASVLAATIPWLTTRGDLLSGVLFLAALVLAARAGDARGVAATLLPYVALVGGLALFDLVNLDVFLPGAGYYRIRTHTSFIVPLEGAVGLFFDRPFGLASHAPIYLLAFLGLPELFRRARDGAGRLVAALALGWLGSFALVATLATWHGDWSPAPRYLVAGLPFLAIAAAFGIALVAERGSRALRAVAGIAAAWTAAVTFLYAALPAKRYDLAPVIRSSDSSGELWDYLRRFVPLVPGDAFPVVLRPSTATLALAAAWVVVAIVLVLAGSRLSRAPIAAPVSTSLRTPPR